MASSFLSRIAEERIHDAQQRGVFDNLPGRGKPIPSHDLRTVPEDLRLAYHILKNAHILPPEAALHKEIHQLQDLLQYIQEDGQRKALVKEIEWKMIRLDLSKRRSLSLGTSRFYGRKLIRKFLRRPR